MPPAMRQLAWVQMCTWLGLFCMWLYFPVAVARNVFGAPDQSSPVYTEGIGSLGGICCGTYSAVCFFFIVIPEILASVAFGWIMAHLLNNNRLSAVVLGGAFLLLAAALVHRVREAAAEMPAARATGAP